MNKIIILLSIIIFCITFFKSNKRFDGFVCGAGGGGGTDYAPTSTGDVTNRTYVGPSTEDKNLCARINPSRPCGNVSAAKGSSGRCIRSISSCQHTSGGGCGTHPYHCGTCMKRKSKGPVCVWNSWSAWSGCNNSCGGGQQTKTRSKKESRQFRGSCEG